MPDGRSFLKDSSPHVEQPEWWFGELEKRHEIACAAVRIEEYVSQVIDGNISWKEFERRMEPLQIETQLKLIEAGEAYVTQFRKTETTLKNLYAAWNIPGPGAVFAERLFQEQTGREPTRSARGQTFLRVEIKEGYVCLIINNDTDYRSFFAGSETDPGVGTRSDHSGGYFDRSLVVHTVQGTLPVMVIREISMVSPAGTVISMNKKYVDDVILHERQHFINAFLFGEFFDEQIDLIKKKKKSEDIFHGSTVRDVLKEVHGHARLKDEILANLREGKTADRIREGLNPSNPNYVLNFSGPRGGEIFDAALAQVKDLEPFIESPRARAILVYHLVDVPLASIPSRLRKIHTYLKRTCTELRRAEDSVTTVVPMDAVFGSARKKTAAAAADLLEQYEMLSAFGGKMISKAAQQKRREYEVVVQDVSREGALLPYVRVKEQTFEATAADVAEQLASISQTTVDLILYDVWGGSKEALTSLAYSIDRSLSSIQKRRQGPLTLKRFDDALGILVGEMQVDGTTMELTFHATKDWKERIGKSREKKADPVLPSDVRLPDLSALQSKEYVRTNTVEFSFGVEGCLYVGSIEFYQTGEERVSVQITAREQEGTAEVLRYAAARDIDQRSSGPQRLNQSGARWHVFTHNVKHVPPERVAKLHQFGIRALEQLARRINTDYPHYGIQWIQLIPETGAEIYRLIDREWLQRWLSEHPGERIPRTVIDRIADEKINEGYIPIPHQEKTIISLMGNEQPHLPYGIDEYYLVKPLEPSIFFTRQQSYE